MLTTVLFDFDGTLADTNHLISESYLHVLNKYFPGEYDTEGVRHFNGPPLEEVFGNLLPEKADQMVREYREYNHAQHDALIQTFPDVNQSLRRLKAAGLNLAVVSTKYNAVLLKGLDLLEMTPYFHEVIGGNDYQKVKPDPEPLQVAMSRLGVKPEECLMVGDNWHDIQAGHNAGMESVFVSWSQKTTAEMAPYQPDKIVDSMVDLTEWILSKTGGN
ncbi:pyrophosphatase PpaX [Vagococcus sp. BWB3-3]|uniref:Pyrophosphatase PpaX n=1 Tax=Vagococcus allomyrinae TaxID=2794353 RepID=A0A940PHR0_9ENTE|nr:pyrophosphatase PpaX [Vagococcus allomyrinae]MBP1044148.1 pyrophosphatase PpaX [Vagococcus allomyrinae]